MSFGTFTYCLTMALALSLQHSADKTGVIKATRVNLVGTSATSIQDRFSGYIPRAFAPKASNEKLAITTYFRNTKGVTNGELLIQSGKATPLKQVAIEPDGRFETVQWSPNGKQIAYLTSPLNKTADVSPKQLTVVVLQSGKKMKLSDDAAALHWSADGNTLSYFQRKPDGWMAYHSTGWQGTSAPLSSTLPALRLPSPGAFASDGKRVAFLEKDRIKVIKADGKPVSEFSLPQEMEMKSLQWSPDDRRLMAQAREVFSHERLTRTFLIEPTTGKQSTLEESLSKEVSLVLEMEEISVRVAGWLPGAGHRIIANAMSFSTRSGQPFRNAPLRSSQEINGKWLVYSPDNGSVRKVEGIKPISVPENNEDAFSFSDRDPQIATSPDGRFVLINGRSYQFTGLR